MEKLDKVPGLCLRLEASTYQADTRTRWTRPGFCVYAVNSAPSHLVNFLPWNGHHQLYCYAAAYLSNRYIRRIVSFVVGMKLRVHFPPFQLGPHVIQVNPELSQLFLTHFRKPAEVAVHALSVERLSSVQEFSQRNQKFRILSVLTRFICLPDQSARVPAVLM